MENAQAAPRGLGGPEAVTSRLPGSVDELRGRRAARWIRESTPGQFDRYGPDAQAELIDRSIARLGLADTGLTWSAAHSGSTVHAAPAMRAMLAAAAAGEFDVLVVGYVARWQRNLRQTLNLLDEDLHPAGVAVWFADEELLSSNERHWDQLVDEAKGAESWLRKHRRRVREGYAAKLATRHDPGGRPPFGFRRNASTKLMEPDPDRLAAVQAVYELAARRLTDREVAAAAGVPLDTVRGILTSPLYVGRLRAGERAHWAAVVDVGLWEEVQAIRARRRTRDGRAGIRRPYALTMLHCAACGRHLIGDTGRYRHPEPCSAFVAVRREPRRRIRGQRRAMPGHSYRADEYEAIVREVLERSSLGADVIADVIALTRDPEPDRLAIARIGRERDAALARYRRDRDARALEATMAVLDRGEHEARTGATLSDPLPAAEVVEYLRDLPRLWDAAPASRRGLAEAVFERIEVLGLRRMRISPTPAALAAGLAEAFSSASAGYGRGERAEARATQQIRGCRVTMEGAGPVLIERLA
jgi:DNA invertase Pin-like site-specific DNA recombinase